MEELGTGIPHVEVEAWHQAIVIGVGVRTTVIGQTAVAVHRILA